jgi:precorrin-8X/cobalt-precorrin-8 methylmutase
MKTGVVLLGHGSRLAGASQVLHQLSQAVQQRGGWTLVEPAFLQFEHPTLSESIDKLVRNGAERVVVVSFFLWEGNHVHRDIPHKLKNEAQKHKGVQFAYTPALGHHPRMVDIVLDRIREVIR